MKQIHKNIGFTGISQLCATFLAFILVPIAARYLGKEDYGLYTVATTVGFFVGLLADFGVSTIVTREISKKRIIATPFFARVMALKIVLTLGSLIILLFYMIFSHYSPKAQMTILIFVGASILGTFSQAAFAVFRGFEQMQYEAIGVVVDKLVSVILGISLLFMGFGVKIFVFSFIVSGCVKLLFTFYVLYKKFIKPKIIWTFKQSSILLQVSFFFGLSTFLSVCYNYLDVLMLSAMSTFGDIAYYSAAHKLLTLTAIVPTILATAFLPQFSAHFNQNDQLSLLFSKGTLYLILFVFPLIAGVMLLAEPLITIIYTAEYSGGIIAMRILTFASVAQIFNIFFVPLYAAINQQKKIVLFQIVGLFINITLNLILIPKLSYIGASFATVATETIIFTLIYWWIKRFLKVSLFPKSQYFLKVGLCTLIMSVSIVVLKYYELHFLLIVLLAILIYFLALETTKTISLFNLVKAVTKEGLRAIAQNKMT